MKISHEWLSDFVDWIETDPEVIADRLTRSTGEVDDLVRLGRFLDRTVVGKLTSVEKHPQADRLAVCKVETDEGTKQVVCGGTNLKTGMLVAFAHVGATVKWHGGELATLQKVKLRGVESEGMICAQEELELEMFPSKPEDGERPIADLSGMAAKVGTPLREALGLNDVVYHIDNHAITNRPDLFSHVGVARECVALGLATWKKKAKATAPAFTKQPTTVTCKNDIPNLIPRYCACSIELDNTVATPDWMKKRLAATGWRSINLAVDVTNYVSMELGMPLHSFDTADIKGEVHMRTADQGEKIVTLDEVERVLPAGAIVLSDDEGIFDLLGIMGGLRSGSKSSTTSIYLHAAIVDPVSIRRAVIATGHRTDAATTYEKGVPAVKAEEGLLRAAELILMLSPGAKIVSKMTSEGKVPAKKAVKISPERFSDVIGADVKPAAAKKILADLGCDVDGTKEWSVTPPLWRNDLNLPEDLVEEVARVHGYANIAPVMPEATTAPPPRDHRLNAVRDALKEAGWYELLHLAFTSPSQMKKAGLDPAKAESIENPLGEELSLMRTDLLPAMLETVGREVKKCESGELKAFEVGRVFVNGTQPEHLCLVVAARGKTSLPAEPLLRLKAELREAMERMGHAVDFAPTSESLPPYGHPGRSAAITHGGKTIGLLTEIQPEAAKAFDLPSRAAVATIDLELLKKDTPAVQLFRSLPAFPSIELDETIAVPKTQFAVLSKKLRSLDPLLQDVRVVGTYEDASTRTITLRFVYRADDRTLVQQDAENVHKRVLEELKKA